MENYGLIEVHKGETADVDIVFLHGLRGDARATWSKDSVLWPQDLLAKDVPNSRILLYGYDSGITHWDQSAVSQTDLRSDSEDLCAKLAAKRTTADTKERPIILIAHSLGGLVAAQAVTLGAARPEGDAAHDIASHVRGMMFFGTPFRGSPTAQPAEIVRKILSTLHINTQESTLKLLGVDSEKLTALNYNFPEVLRKRQSSKTAEEAISAFFFYETLKTNRIMVVEAYSAQLPGCGESAPLRANHVDMCKFGSETDEGYDVALMNIRQMIVLAKGKPRARNGDRTINNNNSKILNQATGDINLNDIKIDNF